jgi:hypothetical protein
MTTTNGNRPILDLTRWEMCSAAPVATAAARFTVSSRHYRQQQLYVDSATSAWLYNPYEDAWVAVPSPALGGAFAAGACGTATAIGPSGTATAGTTSTITTNLTIARDLRGYSIHITGGPNAGATLEILGNTVGANSVITVAAQASAFTTSTTYRLLTPRWYILNAITAAGTTTANVFRLYDFALNTWSAAETGATDGVAPAAVIGTDSRLVATPSWIGTDYRQFATGTATSATATTLVNSAKTWTTNQFTNYQVRIVSGTGAGQIRTISSNTGTTLTVPTWTTTPDATSVYSIEGNDDHIYYMGSNAVTLYRYSISAGTWTTLTPGTARGAAPGAGMSGHWIYGVTDSAWTNESLIRNGRYIYSFRGAGGAIVDRYDLALNTWENDLLYAPKTEVFTTGTKWIYDGDEYLYCQRDATNRWIRFSVLTHGQNGYSTMPALQGAAVLGDTAFDIDYIDGGTTIKYLYMILNTSNILLRSMVV